MVGWVIAHSDLNAIVGEDKRRVGRSKFGSRHLVCGNVVKEKS